MKDESSLGSHLLSNSVDAFERGLHEAAYHALLAALHVAESTRDQALLSAVESASSSQLAAVEAATPAHRLSRAAAQRRNTRPVYETLKMHINAVRLRWEADARRSSPANQ